MPQPPRVLIVSSDESRNIAEEIQLNLEPFAHCQVWSQGVFTVGKLTLPSLIESVADKQFAIVVFAGDDHTNIRGKEMLTPRDNVVFEAGLLIGQLGMSKVFILHARQVGAELRQASDLLGITTASFDASRSDVQAALGGACTQIKDAIRFELGQQPRSGRNWELFDTVFGNRMQVLLNWERVLNEHLQIDISVVTSRSDIAGWFSPWYVDGAGQQASSFKDAGVRPLRVLEVPAHFGGLEPSRRDKINLIAESYTDAVMHPEVVLPVAVYCTERCTVVLDGNHRLAALLLATRPFKLLVFSVSGPIDSGILPDLIHWERPHMA
jgi:hypothetical protein